MENLELIIPARTVSVLGLHFRVYRFLERKVIAAPKGNQKSFILKKINAECK